MICYFAIRERGEDILVYTINYSKNTRINKITPDLKDYQGTPKESIIKWVRNNLKELINSKTVNKPALSGNGWYELRKTQYHEEI